MMDIKELIEQNKSLIDSIQLLEEDNYRLRLLLKSLQLTLMERTIELDKTRDQIELIQGALTFRKAKN